MTDTSHPCQRISQRPGEKDAPRVERVDGVWHLRGTQVVRQLLRTQGTTQAGFTAEAIRDRLKVSPILFMDGEAHRRQRAKVARYFAPRTVTTRYRELMERRADALIAEMDAAGTARLDQVTLRYSVDVAAQVIGLTSSNVDAMARRLERFFNQPSFDLTKPGVGRSRFQAIQSAIRGNVPMMMFYLADVRPAIAARRKQRSDDVISHLIDEEYSGASILIECVTYGAAGMVTTREFLSMATLHLTRDPALGERYVNAEEPERLAILDEILRLEPVVGHLYRRAASDVEIVDGDTTHTIAAGELVNLAIRPANADPATVGERPLSVCPGRDLPKGIGGEVMAFGDGPHKCPGNALAIQESDVFLHRLLRRGVRVVKQPTLGWDDLIAGYSLRGLEIALG